MILNPVAGGRFKLRNRTKHEFLLKIGNLDDSILDCAQLESQKSIKLRLWIDFVFEAINDHMRRIRIDEESIFEQKTDIKVEIHQGSISIHESLCFEASI